MISCRCNCFAFSQIHIRCCCAVGSSFRFASFSFLMFVFRRRLNIPSFRRGRCIVAVWLNGGLWGECKRRVHIVIFGKSFHWYRGRGYSLGRMAARASHETIGFLFRKRVGGTLEAFQSCTSSF